MLVTTFHTVYNHIKDEKKKRSNNLHTSLNRILTFHTLPKPTHTCNKLLPPPPCSPSPYTENYNYIN